MRFSRPSLATLIGISLLAGGFVAAAAGLRVHLATSPPRESQGIDDFDPVLTRIEEVRFRAPDGPMVAGWLLPGDPSRPPILLCHDLGRSKASLVALGMELSDHGFPVLLFDFRGHGESEGGRSTLGLKEKRDVLGALEYLNGQGILRDGIAGVYGVGMGAHAAVLAAVDRPRLKVLVLDGLYPDAGFPLTRRVYAGWDTGVRYLSFVPTGVFGVMNRVDIAEHRAAEWLPTLLGRDLLLLAPAGDSDLASAMESMYASIPDQRDVDGNLVLLPATQSQGLYGGDVARHHRRVAEFFMTRFPKSR